MADLRIPAYDELPVAPGAPPGASWGVFGAHDQVGSLNFAGSEEVISAASECPTVRAVASVGAPYDPGHVERHYDALIQYIEAEGEAQFLVGGKALTLKRAFVEDVRAADLRECIRTLCRALLVLHSPTDNTVGIENASEIFRLARHPRSFVSLEGSDHLLTARGQAHRAGRIIGAWADAYLDDP